MSKKTVKDQRLDGFGRRLTAIRQRKGLSRRELADLAGLDHTSFARWEAGEVYPGLVALVALMDALGVPFDCLLGLRPLPPLDPAVAAKLDGEEPPAKRRSRRTGR